MLFAAVRDPRTLRTTLSRAFLTSLLSTPAGRAYVLTQAGIAERTDEGAVFEHLAARVEDAELQRMVTKHAQDEERHAALFFDCADRQGVGRPAIPTDMRVLDRLDAKVHLFGHALETDEDVMRAYLVLQVIEERAVEQFSIIEPVMRRHDPRTADVLRGITKDEERHLLYCRAITKRYAPDEATRVRALEELRDAEAAAFRQHEDASVRHLLSRDDVLPAAMRLFWRAAVEVLSHQKELPYTRFHGQTHGDVALVA